MRSLRSFLGVLVVLAAVPTIARAQGSAPKIVYIDSDAVIKQAPGYSEANDAFNNTAGAWRDTLEAKRSHLQELYDAYKKQEVILSPEKKTEKQQEIVQLEQEAQEYFQKKFGPDGEANAKQAELMKPILERVNQAIEATRREGGYALIFDLSNGALVAGDPALNITDQVVQRLRSQATSAPSR